MDHVRGPGRIEAPHYPVHVERANKQDHRAQHPKVLIARHEGLCVEGIEDEDVVTFRTKMGPDYALHIEKDSEKAVELHKAMLPENWNEDPNLLNNIAWWCFENGINLDEAETLARKGIELSDPGTDRANIYDTLAEICNLNGNCGDAVDYIRLAIKDAPDNEYFPKQEKRFEQLLLAQMNK